MEQLTAILAGALGLLFIMLAVVLYRQYGPNRNDKRPKRPRRK